MADALQVAPDLCLSCSVLFWCADWVLVDGACHAYSFVPVPLYDTLGAEAVQYIIKHAELAAIACSIAVFPTLLQALPDCPGVKLVVSASSFVLWC